MAEQGERGELQQEVQGNANAAASGAARAFSVVYLVLQSISILFFWALVLMVPGVRSKFVFENAPDGVFLAFAFADGVFLPTTGLLAAYGMAYQTRWKRTMLWMHAGAAVYAGLHAIGQWCFDSTLWLSAGMMIPVLITPALIASGAGSKSRMGTMTGARALFWSFAQIVVFWGFFLCVLPAGFRVLEAEISGPDMFTITQHVAMRSLSGVLLIAGSLLGLWSCWCLAVRGVGTPLPLMPTRRLVVIGPYSLVRNPMAIGGLLQGLGVGLWVGSWVMVLCILLGGVIWHTAIRPAEEAELERSFTDEYRSYKKRVRCWIPRV